MNSDRVVRGNLQLQLSSWHTDLPPTAEEYTTRTILRVRMYVRCKWLGRQFGQWPSLMPLIFWGSAPG